MSMCFDRWNGDARRAYTQAIMDVMEVIEGGERDLAHFKKKMTMPELKRLLACILENRANLLDQRNGFIRYNGPKGAWEWYDMKEKG